MIPKGRGVLYPRLFLYELISKHLFLGCHSLDVRKRHGTYMSIYILVIKHNRKIPQEHRIYSAMFNYGELLTNSPKPC